MTAPAVRSPAYRAARLLVLLAIGVVAVPIAVLMLLTSLGGERR